MILQIDFVDERPVAEGKEAVLNALAHTIAQTPGLIWKIWTENPETREAGGIYLFEDEASLAAYLTLHTARLQGMGIGQINAKQFQVNQPLSAITCGRLNDQCQGVSNPDRALGITIFMTAQQHLPVVKTIDQLLADRVPILPTKFAHRSSPLILVDGPITLLHAFRCHPSKVIEKPDSGGTMGRS